jgi:hypothetical protein
MVVVERNGVIRRLVVEVSTTRGGVVRRVEERAGVWRPEVVLAVVVEERGGVVRSVVGESDSACTPGIVGVFLPAMVLPLVELLGDGVFRP